MEMNEIKFDMQNTVGFTVTEPNFNKLKHVHFSIEIKLIWEAH